MESRSTRSPRIDHCAIATLLVSLSTCLGWGTVASAQVVPDTTLPTTVTTPDNRNFTIDGGAQSGSNLFHSFEQFSVPTGGSAFFNNSITIHNIFARVTGGNVSHIDGILRANGTASLFLMNPAGIVFGSNARLNLGGSFISTSASSIKFADGTEFRATNPSSAPLLTVSVPVGLQMGSNPAPITVQGTGHTLISIDTLAPVTQNPSSSELRVQPGKTLALVGGNLELVGATLNTPQGRVELGSLSGAGLVSLTPISQGYQLGYQSGQSFGDIQLVQKSLLTVGALPSVEALNAGSVQLQGRYIQFSDGSLILSKNLGSAPGGELFLQASEGIDINGTTADALIRSGIRSEALNTGTSSSIRVLAPRFTISQGATLSNITFGAALGGGIQIDAGAVEVLGSAPINPVGVTALATSSRQVGTAGNITINSQSLLVSEGGSIGSIALGSGSTGQVTIHSTDTTLTGDSPAGIYSNINATTYGTGNAQTVTVDTARLKLLNGGAVATTSFLIGRAGNVNVNATESILIEGSSRFNNSSINSAVLFPPQIIQQAFGLPNILLADAGNVTITTPHLILVDRGTVSVTNQGSGDGGNIKIASNRISLARQGSIQAQTASGAGGDIRLQTSSLLLLRHNSLISATSGGTGNGGNITLHTPIIAGFDNSDITANAVLGSGGNIQITTQGIFGLAFRNQPTSGGDITASSQFGVSGTVSISTPDVQPDAALVELPQNLADPSQKIAQGCASNSENRFVATGRGGLPENPTQRIGSDRTWSDVRDLSVFRHAQQVQTKMPEPPQLLVEATSWQRNAQGKIELFADQSPSQIQRPLTCAVL